MEKYHRSHPFWTFIWARFCQLDLCSSDSSAHNIPQPSLLGTDCSSSSHNCLKKKQSQHWDCEVIFWLIIIALLKIGATPEFSDTLEVCRTSSVHQQNSTGDGGLSSLESETCVEDWAVNWVICWHSMEHIEELLGFIGIYLDQYVKYQSERSRTNYWTSAILFVFFVPGILTYYNNPSTMIWLFLMEESYHGLSL